MTNALPINVDCGSIALTKILHVFVWNLRDHIKVYERPKLLAAVVQQRTEGSLVFYRAPLPSKAPVTSMTDIRELYSDGKVKPSR